MSEPKQPSPTKGYEVTPKVTLAVLSVLAAALFAWAGVVFTAWQDTREMLYSVGARLERVQAAVEASGRDSRRLAHELERHEDRPWHDAAGNSLSTMRTELDALKAEKR